MVGDHVPTLTFIMHVNVMVHVLAHVYELLGPCFKTGPLEPASLTPHPALMPLRYQVQKSRKDEPTADFKRGDNTATECFSPVIPAFLQTALSGESSER